METHTHCVKFDRIGHALCIKCVKLIVKYFILADNLFLGGVLDLDTFSFGRCVLSGRLS